MATHVEKDGLGALAQGHHIHARRHRKQDVPHAHPLAGAVGALVRRIVAAARFFRGFGHVQVLLQQRVDGVGCRFADHAVGGGCVVRIQQAGGLRGLAQQLGAGALAQLVGRKLVVRGVQCHAVDACQPDARKVSVVIVGALKSCGL